MVIRILDGDIRGSFNRESGTGSGNAAPAKPPATPRGDGFWLASTTSHAKSFDDVVKTMSYQEREEREASAPRRADTYSIRIFI